MSCDFEPLMRRPIMARVSDRTNNLPHEPEKDRKRPESHNPLINTPSLGTKVSYKASALEGT